MELIKNLRFMCRICAVNIKKRRINSNAVSILNNPQLKEKLNKYLNLNINFNDVLPKSICSVCYKKVESIHALAALAKKTENFLNDFIKIAQTNLQETQSTSIQNHFQNEFNSFALLGSQDDFMCDEDEAVPSEPEEVVLNFTLNDPLTKNIQKKIVVAKQQQQQQQLQQQQQQRNSNQNQEISISQQLRSNMSDASEIFREMDKADVNSSLEQKRQNLKMILNNNTNIVQQNPQSMVQQNNTETSTNNYKVNIVPTSSNTSLNQHSINVAVQIQQQPNIYQQQQQQQRKPFESNTPPFNSNRSNLMNDCLNLGSVIKDMDLLKLILKALKWTYTQDTLMTQIQRLKSTRFRDVMVDPNLLQDADLMQILSSYLSPILLQNLTTAQFPSPSQFQQMAIAAQQIPPNILPPSVSYKIPAETSVRLVSVPREEEKQPLQKPMQTFEQPSLPPPPLRQNKKHKSKSSRRNQEYRRPPVIVLSDDSSEEKFEVNVDPTLYFQNVDSSYENSNESASYSYMKQRSMLSNQDLYGSMQEIQQPKRKKQKRKQSLIRIQTDKEFGEQEIVIVDENGEKPIRLCGNEITVIPKHVMSKQVEPSAKQNSIEIISSPKKKTKSIRQELTITGVTKQKQVATDVQSLPEEKQKSTSAKREASPDVVILPAPKEEKSDEQNISKLNIIENEDVGRISQSHPMIEAKVEKPDNEEEKLESQDNDDIESNTDTNDKLIIDEDHVDDDKQLEELEEEEEIPKDFVESKPEEKDEKDTKVETTEEEEEDEINKDEDKNQKPTEIKTSEVGESSNLRRSRRQVKVKEFYKKSSKRSAEPTKSPLLRKSITSTRIKTRQQLLENKVQTRTTKKTKRGRPIKPCSKYSPSKKRL